MSPTQAAMNVLESTRRYENWMTQQVELIPSQLAHKHALMKSDPLAFFRGTYYRWAELWRSVVHKSVQAAPAVVAVGDLHIDSFGTWRDVEGRLIWGVDDFDEAFPLPYTNDLVRLAASVKIAKKTGAVKISLHDACTAIMEGYRDSLRKGGAPITLAEGEHFLETLGIAELKPPEDFWKKLNRLPASQRECPRVVCKAFEQTLPDSLPYKLVSRTAGTGSLGQPRFAAIAEWKGGHIAREAKAMVPSALASIENEQVEKSYYNQIIESAVRAHDPFQKVIDGWLIRRLSPDSNPISISEWPKKRDEFKLLRSMGREAANVHLGSTRQIEKILQHLKEMEPTWLMATARQMAREMLKNWKEYRHSD